MLSPTARITRRSPCGATSARSVSSRITLSLLRCKHPGNPPDARVTSIQVVLFVENPVARFDKLSQANAHAIADGTDNPAVPVQFQELAVLTAGHPGVATRVELKCANKISHLHRPEELSVAAVNDDAVLLTIADPDVTIRRIHSKAVS